MRALAICTRTRCINPSEGFLHGPYEQDGVRCRDVVVDAHKAHVVIITIHVVVVAVVAAPCHCASVSLLVEDAPADRALALTLHPRDQAVVVEHMVAWSHQHLIVGHEGLQANGTILSVVLLRVVGLTADGPVAEQSSGKRPPTRVGSCVHLLPERLHGLLELIVREARVLRFLPRSMQLPLLADPWRRVPYELPKSGAHFVGSCIEQQKSHLRVGLQGEPDPQFTEEGC